MRRHTEAGVDGEVLTNIQINTPVLKDDDLLIGDTKTNISR